MTGQSAQVLDVLRLLEAWGHERRWHGSDQYDALNAKRLPAFARSTVLRRRLVIQLVKRSPVNLRPALGIPPGQNAVSLAWMASAYAINGFLAEAEAERRMALTLDALDRLRCGAYDEPCWGYHFDFQSRVFFYPRTEPNTIATAFAGMALLDCFERTGSSGLLHRAHAVGQFFLRRVPQTVEPPGAFFGYLVGDRSPIHNANMLVCALLARLSAHTGDPRMAERAEQAALWTLARQRPDGSFPYGERPGLRWIDGFHTGYVLDALAHCLHAGIIDDRRAVNRALDFYRRRLLLADGTPKYYAEKTYPIDMWSVAQAIQTLSIAARREPDALPDALAVFAFAMRKMRRSDGLFVFQRRPLWSNRTCHVRGAVAPMALALAHLLARLRSGPPHAGRSPAITNVVAST